MDSRAFVTFGLPHCAALTATAIAAIYMVRLKRAPFVEPGRKHRANVILAFVLVVAVALDPVLTWLRYRADPAVAMQQVRTVALPFYLCDVVSLVLAYA